MIFRGAKKLTGLCMKKLRVRKRLWAVELAEFMDDRDIYGGIPRALICTLAWDVTNDCSMCML